MRSYNQVWSFLHYAHSFHHEKPTKVIESEVHTSICNSITENSFLCGNCVHTKNKRWELKMKWIELLYTTITNKTTTMFTCFDFHWCEHCEHECTIFLCYCLWSFFSFYSICTISFEQNGEKKKKIKTLFVFLPRSFRTIYNADA